MRRREFIAGLGGAAAWPFATIAQHTSKWYRVSYIALLPGEDSGLIEPLLQRLRELGYSRDFLIEYRWAAGESSRLRALADELLAAKVDLIVTQGAATTLAAKETTTTIPIAWRARTSSFQLEIRWAI
jgi:putative ABC transport system substrate-binding protein